jgi:succinate dehydrogenase / fumarate reductase cytochrome b subunit
MSQAISQRPPLPGALTLYRTTIGKKVVMAATGVVWFGYVIGHLLGNLQIYAGPQRINEYSEFLHHTPSVLWGTRLVLGISLIAHVIASIQLTLVNLEARPIPYATKDDVATTYAARTMVYSGPILLAFILYHLAHLTFGIAPGTEYDAHNVYNNVVHGFQIWWLSLFYIGAQMLLGLHLYHGVWSAFQTVGANHPRYNAWRRRFATAITAAIVAGYVSIPISVAVGILEPATASPAHGAR